MPRKLSAPREKNPYGVHPGIAMTQKWIVELPQKTGRSLEEWVQLIKATGFTEAREVRAWLKDKHQLGTNSAWWLADRALDPEKARADEDPEAYLAAAVRYVEAMFAGSKAGLRPLYKQLLHLGLGVGPDVKACPCQTIVPLYRNHVFAQIKPTTRTRIDMGFALGDTRASGRLIDTGGFAKKDRITHRIPISTPGDIDAEVRQWLQTAYERDA